MPVAFGSQLLSSGEDGVGTRYIDSLLNVGGHVCQKALTARTKCKANLLC